jgi:hypothetical protein
MSNHIHKLLYLVASMVAFFGLLLSGPLVTAHAATAPVRVTFVSESPTYWCKNCGAPHGGVYSADYCHKCIEKGEAQADPE